MARTSSLNRKRSGSTSLSAIFSGRPPTLWWLLILCAAWAFRRARFDHIRIDGALHQEIHLAELRAPAASNARMKVSPMARRLCSGSVMPRSAYRKSAEASV